MNTTKLGLKKPEGTDLVNIQDFNENVDVIEQQLEQRPIKTGDASNMTTSFTQATTVGNIASGEAIKTSFGKIAKTIADYVSHKATTATTSILGHVKFGTAAGTACQGNDSRLSDSRTPKSHAVTTTTYGIGTASNYGHVKLSDTFSSTVTNGAAANGMAASQKAVADFYNQINSNLNEWNGQMPILRSCSPNDVPDYKVCRMFGSTDPVPFGISGDNDYILTSYWYADGKGDSAVAQMAYNIRDNETATRRYHPTYGWQPWVISSLQEAALIPSAWITRVDHNYITKYNKSVCINALLVRTDGDIPAGYVIATVPEGYTPAHTVYRMPAILRKTSTGEIKQCVITIAGSGEIYTEASISTNTYNEIGINANYITKS